MKKVMSRFFLFLLIFSVCSPVTRAEQEPLVLAPLCFTGEVDYVHEDERLAIHIQKRQEPNLVYYVCDIQTNDPLALRTALSGEEAYGVYEPSSDIAERHGAVLAVNGDCYGYHRTGIIIRNGELIRAKRSSNRHLLTMDAQGNLSVIANRQGENPALLAETLLSRNVMQAWEFGPELVRGGELASLDVPFDLLSTSDRIVEPRTAIGQIGPLHYVVIVVDGRVEYSEGVSLQGLQEMMQQTGAVTAFNLDGGGSTTLYFEGAVLNHPSSGGERGVSDILFF